MSEEGLALVETNADRLLADVGMEIRDDPEVAELFQATPAPPSTASRVRFDPGHVQALCATAPRQFTQLARNPARSVEIGGDNVVFARPTARRSCATSRAAGATRSLVDFQNFVKLTYVTPWLHHCGGTVCEPVDVPVNKRHLDMVYAHLRYSDKAFMGSVTQPSRAADSIEMARIVFGADVVDSNCVIMGNVNVNSPLVWDATMTGALRDLRGRQPGPVVVPFILGGADGPRHHCRRRRPGPRRDAGRRRPRSTRATRVARDLRQLPVVDGAAQRQPDVRHARARARFVGRRPAGPPGRSAAAVQRSIHVLEGPDGQAMSESAVSMMSALLCGANFILHSAGWLEGGLAMGYEKFMMDLDLCGAAHTYLKGFDLSADQFALDGFVEIGPGKHFFSAQHTLRHYETAFYEPALSDSSRSSSGATPVNAPARSRRRLVSAGARGTTRPHRSTTRSTLRCSSSSKDAKLRCQTSGTDSQRELSPDDVAFDVQAVSTPSTGGKLRARSARRDTAPSWSLTTTGPRVLSRPDEHPLRHRHAHVQRVDTACPGRYVFVPVEGPVVLFEFGTCMYLQEDLDSVDEVRKSVPWFYFLAGPRTRRRPRCGRATSSISCASTAA